MKTISICTMSDMHGILPNVDRQVDIICICGDIFPLKIERNIKESELWFNNDFLSWIKKLPCECVIIIPGNHCIYLESVYQIYGKVQIPNSINKKCVCLVDEMFIYKDIKFYGTPWVTNLSRWAFNTDVPLEKFRHIPDDCDVLLTHHAPDYGKLGCSFPGAENEKNYGCRELAMVILERPNIKYHFCGHIHTGTHGGVKLGNTISYNVSILDEQYQEAFAPTYVEFICDDERG